MLNPLNHTSPLPFSGSPVSCFVALKITPSSQPGNLGLFFTVLGATEDAPKEDETSEPQFVSIAPFSVESRLELQRLLETHPDIVRRELKLDNAHKCPECKRSLGSTAQHRARHFKYVHVQKFKHR